MSDQVNIAENVRDQFLKDGSITVDAGVVTVDKEAVTKALEEHGVNEKEYRRLQKTATTVATGILDAAGEVVVDAMDKEKDLAAVTGEFNIGHEKYSTSISREASVPIPGKPDMEPNTVYGRMRVKRKMSVGGSGVKTVTDRIAALGVKKLGK